MNKSIETLFQQFAERHVDSGDPVQVEEMAAYDELSKLIENETFFMTVLEKLNEFQYLAERAGYYAGFAAARKLKP